MLYIPQLKIGAIKKLGAYAVIQQFCLPCLVRYLCIPENSILYQDTFQDVFEMELVERSCD